MKERRITQRRGLRMSALFPFLDRAGRLVFEDRCRIADRRINSIGVKSTPAAWLRHLKNPNGIHIKE